MRNYREVPSPKLSYGVFLIRNELGLTDGLIKTLYQSLLVERSIISLERLFKGEKTALVIFAPHQVILKYQTVLNLLELEDYSQNINLDAVSIWDVAATADFDNLGQFNKLKESSEHLQENDQFFWQLVLQPTKQDFFEKVFRRLNSFFAGEYQQALKKRLKTLPKINQDEKEQFLASIRAVLTVSDQQRRKDLELILGKIGSESGLVAIPSIYPTSQRVKFYQERSLFYDPGRHFVLTVKQLVLLVLIR